MSVGFGFIRFSMGSLVFFVIALMSPAGLVRYYLYDSTSQSFADATTAAAGRSLFGKSGYLGVFTSDAEKEIYKTLRQHDMHLAMSDDTQLGTTEASG